MLRNRSLPGAVALVLLASPLAAVDYIVTRYDDPAPDTCVSHDCSLREAVLTANADPSADRILLSAGTYALTIGGTGENAAATGDLDLTEDVEIVGPGAGMTAIDGTLIDRVIQILNTATVEISGVTVKRGSAASGGAGITVSGAILTLDGCEIRDNAGSGGQGIFSGVASTVFVRRSTIAGNSGTGIQWSLGAIAIEESTITGNAGPNPQLDLSATAASCTQCTIAGIETNVTVAVHLEATLSLRHSLIRGSCLASDSGAVQSHDGNVESPGHSCNLTDTNDLDDAGNLFLETFGDHGGPTRTLPPTIVISPAVDLVGDTDCEGNDQRGISRPRNGDFVPLAECDAGAVEAVGVNDQPPTPIFADGFLQGNTKAWSDATP